MLCQNCERPIEPNVKSCPHCGATPLHRRVYLGAPSEEFSLTPEEESYEIGAVPETKEWPADADSRIDTRLALAEDDRTQAAEVRRGGFFRRAWALAIDAVVIAALSVVMAVLAYIGYKVGLSAHGRHVTRANAMPLLALTACGAIGLATAYFVLLHGMEGKTIGKKILGLKVVGAEQETIGFPRAFVRWLAIIALAPGVLWVLWSGEKRAWHDYLAGTWVIRG